MDTLKRIILDHDEISEQINILRFQKATTKDTIEKQKIQARINWNLLAFFARVEDNLIDADILDGICHID